MEIPRDNPSRQWPVPDEPWILKQAWNDLLFAHWPVARDRLRELVPPFVDLDLFDGEAWLTLTPFRLSDLRPRGIPALPWISAFDEINVRTYVTRGGKPGIYFFSLDANSTLAVSDYFLTERYCLYTQDAASRAYRVEIQHAPWQLQPAEAEIATNTMAAAAGIRLPSMAPLLHFAKRQDVLTWRPHGLD